MRASKQELPVILEAGEANIGAEDWNGMRVAVVTIPAGTDFGPLLEGLPNDRCPGEHWGYMLEGLLRVQHADNSEEMLKKGDFYHMPPGHTGVAIEDTQFIEIGDPEPHQRFIENVQKNIAAM